jgi:hypothetical protein
MVEILSLLDDYLMAKRDEKRYVFKELKKRTLITMIGSITIKRRYYWDRDEKEWVFLLDQALDLSRAQVSAALKELVVIWATKGPSYRDTRDRLKDLFGSQVLSHETIRQTLIQSSDTLRKTLEPETLKKKVKALFIEADGSGRVYRGVAAGSEGNVKPSWLLSMKAGKSVKPAVTV